jgi:hypothetical protein
MKTIHMRHLLPLAAIALIAAACDPFPAKPGGDPRIVRVTSIDPNWTGETTTTENTGAAPGTVVHATARPIDVIYIQFNKPMNGLTLQKYADYDSNGVKIDPATITEATGICTPPANLTHTFPADTTFCYVPSSVTDGGQVVITPGSQIVAGTTYQVTGPVKDYEGKSLAIDVTISVDPLPVATAVDGLRFPGYGVTYNYGLMVDWFPNGATGYNLEWTTDGGTTWSAGLSVPVSACGPALDFNGGSPPGYNVCEVTLAELAPCTATACLDYSFRVSDAATPTTWRETASLSNTRGPLPVTLTNFAATGSPALIEGAVQLAWTRVKGTLNATKTWVVERTTDDGTGAPLDTGWTDITATLTTTAGAARSIASTTRGGVDLTATPAGTSYFYRVRPNYASGVVHDGAAGHKVSFKNP